MERTEGLLESESRGLQMFGTMDTMTAKDELEFTVLIIPTPTAGAMPYALMLSGGLDMANPIQAERIFITSMKSWMMTGSKTLNL